MASLNDFMRSTSSFAEDDEKKKKMQEQIDQSISGMQTDLANPNDSETAKILGQDTDATSQEISSIQDSQKAFAEPEEAPEIAALKEPSDKKEIDSKDMGSAIGSMFGGGSKPAPEYKMKDINVGQNTDAMAARRKALMDMLR